MKSVWRTVSSKKTKELLMMRDGGMIPRESRDVRVSEAAFQKQTGRF
jgi:hypothetical protein